MCVVKMKSFDWKEFYGVGEHLMEFSNKEAYQRSAVGRYYYACFGVARNYYKTTQHKEVPSHNSHNFLINYFNNSPFNEEQEIGKKLQKIRKYRNKSDYGDKFDQMNLNKSKNISHDLLSMLNNLNESPLYKNF